MINSAHETLIFDCHELLVGKHYMNVILSLAQAYETFFALYFRVELVYRPFGAIPGQSLDDLNRLIQGLSDKIKKHAFVHMRSLFLGHVIAGKSPNDISDAAAMVSELPDKPGDPKDSAIRCLGDADLASLLMAVKATRVNELRNDVAHKRAYRPSARQARDNLGDAERTLFPLTYRLDLHDDVNWYAKGLGVPPFSFTPSA